MQRRFESDIDFGFPTLSDVAFVLLHVPHLPIYSLFHLTPSPPALLSQGNIFSSSCSTLLPYPFRFSPPPFDLDPFKISIPNSFLSSIINLNSSYLTTTLSNCFRFPSRTMALSHPLSVLRVPPQSHPFHPSISVHPHHLLNSSPLSPTTSLFMHLFFLLSTSKVSSSSHFPSHFHLSVSITLLQHAIL